MAVAALKEPDGTDLLHYWRDPDPASLGESAVQFLERLPGPTHIHVSGRDRERCRAVTTLLHGNEPSGLYGVHDVLRRGVKPAIDIHCFIPNVDAARQAPGFIYRMLPHQKDLNRCFRPPWGDSEQERLAREMLDRLEALAPESVIDVHNTSGSSPAFGVTTFMDPRHDALVSLFTRRMVVTGIRLGALMETSRAGRPVVTIECGGSQDPESNRTAIDGLERYFTLDDVLSPGRRDMALEVFHHPMRLELAEGGDIAFGERSLLEGGVTLRADIENHNFGYVGPDDRLGFVSGGLAGNLSVKDPDSGRERVGEFFRLEGDALHPSRRLKLFMVTTNPEIARKDCLFYLVDPAG